MPSETDEPVAVTGPVTVTGDGRPPIPWRIIWAAIGSVLLAAAVILLARELSRVLAWIVMAVFLAVILNPAVDVLVRRLHVARLIAAAIVYVLGFALILGVLAILVQPLVEQGQDVVDDLPRFVEEARAGRGPVGDLVVRFELEKRIAEQQESLRENMSRLGSQSLHVLSVVATTVAGLVTVLVLSFLLLLEAPHILRVLQTVLPDQHRERISAVAADCSRTVTGYMFGNLLISAVAAAATYLFLWITGVPFRGILALWVGVADLIPLVGATLGAAPVIIVAFLHSPVAGFASLAFFVIYQQLENHLLQPVIQSRTVKLSPLTVLVSVLIGVELAGILGALLAIPAAGIVSVIARAVWENRQLAVNAQPETS
jgi:predicted PurR-regulated permease PerM